jgi:hypothetical protein
MADPVTDPKPAALPPELAALEAEAAGLEAETAAAAPPPPGPDGLPAVPVDYAADAAGVIDIAAEALAAFYPSTAPILTADKRARIAKALAPVMEKYGIDLAGIFGKWGAEIGLGFALAQVAVPLVNAIRDDREAAAKAKATAAPPAVPATGPTAATTSAPPASDLYARA